MKKIKIGEVWQMQTGEILKFTEIDPMGKFQARVKSIKTGEWTDYFMEGDSYKLQAFLKANNAVQLDPKDHLEPEQH